jgi:hypothetical protein
MASKIGKPVNAPIFQHFPIDFVKLGAPTWADMVRDDGIYVRSLPLDIAHIETVKAEMQALATKYGITFDGWSVDAGQL